MIYICGCGCRNKKEDLRPINRYKDENGILRCSSRAACKKHFSSEGFVVLREFVCEKCGKICQSKPMGEAQKRCPTCSSIRAKQLNLKAQKRYQAKKANIEPANNLWVIKETQYSHLKDINKGDCKNRDDCLTIYKSFSCMPCKDCDYYKKEDLIKGMTIRSDYDIREFHRVDC